MDGTQFLRLPWFPEKSGGSIKLWDTLQCTVLPFYFSQIWFFPMYFPRAFVRWLNQPWKKRSEDVSIQSRSLYHHFRFLCSMDRLLKRTTNSRSFIQPSVTTQHCHYHSAMLVCAAHTPHTTTAHIFFPFVSSVPGSSRSEVVCRVINIMILDHF